MDGVSGQTTQLFSQKSKMKRPFFASEKFLKSKSSPTPVFDSVATLNQGKEEVTKETKKRKVSKEETNKKSWEFLEFLEFKNFELPRNLTIYWEKQVKSFCGWHTIQGILEKLKIPLLSPLEWKSMADQLDMQLSDLLSKTKQNQNQNEQEYAEKSLLSNGRTDANLINQVLLSKGLQMRAVKWETKTNGHKNFVENVLAVSSFLILYNQVTSHWSYLMKTQIEHASKKKWLFGWVNCDSRLEQPLLMSKMETRKKMEFEQQCGNLWFILQATATTTATASLRVLVPSHYVIRSSVELLERKERRNKEREFASQFKEKKKSRFRYAWKLGQQTQIAKSQWIPISTNVKLLKKKKL